MKKFLLLIMTSLIIMAISCKKTTNNDSSQNNNPCNGVSINITATPSPSTSCITPNGSVSVSASGGTAPFTFHLGTGTFQSNANFTGLAAGNYTVTAKDANGCTGTASVTVGSSAPTINVTATPSNVTSCSANNGSISATASGSNGFTYSINGTSFQATGNFTGLAAGNYTVTAKDVNGCSGTTTATVGTSTPTITVTPNVSPVVPCSTPANNGSITLTGSGGISPYQYSLNGGAFSALATFSNQSIGSVTVQAKDANGCTSSNITVSIGTAAAGPLFTAVKNIINSRCGGCHTGGGSDGGVSFATDCGIVNKALRIKFRSVTQGNMPPSGAIPNSEQQAITNWVNAGGQFNQ